MRKFLIVLSMVGQSVFLSGGAEGSAHRAVEKVSRGTFGAGSPTAARAQPVSAVAAEIPAWFLRAIEDKTRGSGVWIADNADYIEEDGGIEAFGIRWEKGIGGKSMTGRLYSLRDGRELATHWEFRVFWHPVEQAVKAFQFGADGTVGWGEMFRSEDARSTIVEQTFAAPDGPELRIRHETHSEGDREVGRSFNWIDEKWQQRRTYTWVLQH